MAFGMSEWQRMCLNSIIGSISSSNLVVFQTEVGMMVTCIGLFFLFFGIMMMFDRALLAFGNVSELTLFSI
jgi:hypothetical protein